MAKVQVNDGLDRLAEVYKGVASHMGVGTSTQSATKTDTSLLSEVLRKSATESDVGTGKLEYQMRVLGSEAVDEDLAEIGLADGDVGSSEEWQNRINHAVVTHGSGDELQYTLTLEVVNT